MKRNYFVSHKAWKLSVVFLLLIVGWLKWYFKSPNYLFVKRVVDGDTVVLSDGRTVRYLGIDAPEYGQPYYEESKEFNRQLVEGKPVELEQDLQHRDRYGRLLAYVFVQDDNGKRLFVNAELIRSGLAFVYTIQPNSKYADILTLLQREARQNKNGIWATYYSENKQVIANLRTGVFHRLECPAIHTMNKGKYLRFFNAQTALDKGYSPCRRCRPK